MAAKFFAPSRKELRRIAARGRFAVGQRGTAPSTAHVPTEIQTVYGMLERYAAILKKQRPPEMKITGSMVGGRQPGMTHVRGGSRQHTGSRVNDGLCVTPTVLPLSFATASRSCIDKISWEEGRRREGGSKGVSPRDWLQCPRWRERGPVLRH